MLVSPSLAVLNRVKADSILAMRATPSISDSDILAEVLAADDGELAPDVAAMVLRWRFSKKSARRITQLAQQNQCDTISATVGIVLERYLRVGSLLIFLQAKARMALHANPSYLAKPNAKC